MIMYLIFVKRFEGEKNDSAIRASIVLHRKIITISCIKVDTDCPARHGLSVCIHEIPYAHKNLSQAGSVH